MAKSIFNPANPSAKKMPGASRQGVHMMSEEMKTAGPILEQLGADPKARARRLDILKKLAPADREFVECVLKDWTALFPGEVV